MERIRTVLAAALVAASLVTVGPLAAAKDSGTPNVVAIDCAKGDSIQKALKSGTDPIEIVISGFCAERVVVDRGSVTLRGGSGDPELDGITGLKPDGSPVGLEGELGLVIVEGVEQGGATSSGQPGSLPVHLRDLGIRDSPFMGLVVVESAVGLTNVRAERSAGVGVYFTSTSFGIFDRLAAVDNGDVGLRVNRESLANCGSCQLLDNGTWAVAALNNGKVALYDAGTGGGPSVASGPRGVASWYGGRVWLYPATDIVATGGQALRAVQAGAIESFGAAVDGAIWCGLGGELYVTDLEQRSNGGVNNFYTGCTAHFEDGQVTFAGTTLFHTHASGALFDGGTASFDELVCADGGDFVCHGTVTATSTTGCSCS